jgi:hypothetical protein
MEPNEQGDIQRSRELMASARRILRTAVEHVEEAERAVDQVRNTLQVAWLRRAIRERLRDRRAPPCD